LVPPEPSIKKGCYGAIRLDINIHNDSQPPIIVFRDLFDKMIGVVPRAFNPIRLPDRTVDPFFMNRSFIKHLPKMFGKLHKI